jgi:hypothetical protein
MFKELKRCSNCVLDNIEVPDIIFDQNGVCNYCHAWQKEEKKRLIQMEERPWILDDLRKAGRDKDYDCLLGLSGGIDSSMCLHLLIENGIRPLCWSLDNGYNNKKADENIFRMVEKLKVPFFRKVINHVDYADLQSAFIKAGVKNIEIPTDHILMAWQYKIARENNLTRIVGGGNHSTEGIMPPSYGHDAQDLRHLLAIYRTYSKKSRPDVPLMSLPQYIYTRFIKGIKIINLLDYYNYNRQEAIELLSEKYGYKDYGHKHCENTFTSWFQEWYLPTKWNLDKRKPHYSSLINSGQITRKEALSMLLEPHEFPRMGFEEKVLKIANRKHSEFPSNKKLRTFLSKIYAHVKRQK